MVDALFRFERGHTLVGEIASHAPFLRLTISKRFEACALRAANPEHPAHHGGAAPVSACLFQVLRLPRADAAARAVLTDLVRRHDRANRRRASSPWPVYAHRRLHSLRRDGLRSFHWSCPEGLLSADQWRRVRGAVLLHIPLSRRS